jgi:hypothetical protein
MPTEPHFPLSAYQPTYCSLMYPGPPLHRLQPSAFDGAADTLTQFGSQTQADWLCSLCSVLVCDEKGRRREAKAFHPRGQTPFWWTWCDACRAAHKVETASRKELKAIALGIELGRTNTNIKAFLPSEATQDW